MRRCLFVGGGLVLLVCCWLRLSAQPVQDGAATDVAVRLFSTEVVLELDVVPVRATARLCARCPQEKALPLHVTGNSLSKEGRGLTIEPAGGNLIVINDLLVDGQVRVTTASGKTATGAGKWKISAAADGLQVMLTLPSERYVMAVLASEAGAEEPAESLKALAVVARSFALVNPGRHGLEGICDSTHCQAMRMERVPTRVEAAVQATAGETLWFGGRRVAGYFTQNCGGVTADASEVWGGARQAWLVSHVDPYCQRVPSQWHAVVNEQQLREAMAAEGWHVPRPLTSFRIVEKDSSGRATKIQMGGGKKPLVVSAASLRFAVNRVLGWNTLRSDWYAVSFSLQPNRLARLVFEGKGYGHGVGLCQAGAAEMARQGKGYREILGGYFPGARVRVGAGDDGWREAEARGWSLRLVGERTLKQRTQRSGAEVAKGSGGEGDVVAAGEAAWARARGLWGGGAAVRPVVVIAPSTELFRQMTGQAGWALASASGERVVLQPLAVVRRGGALDGLLLHEFLHVLVEADAGEAAPLWLREGLVEMLAGERGDAGAMKPETIDAALRHAASLREAQVAHRAACGLVRRLVAARGLGTVRGWLRSGVPAGVALEGSGAAALPGR